MKTGNAWGYLLLSLGLVAAAGVLALRWDVQVGDRQQIVVTGSARRPITSDVAVLRLAVVARATTSAAAFAQAQGQYATLHAWLLQQGLQPTEIKQSPPQTQEEFYYANERRMSDGYSSRFGLEVTTKAVQTIEKVTIAAPQLVGQGLEIAENYASYYYTSLQDLKVEMQAEAAKNAAERGAKIAEATGRKLGALTSARMGVIQITPLNSNQVEDYGMNDNSSVEKEITAVVNATFLLE